MLPRVRISFPPTSVDRAPHISISTLTTGLFRAAQDLGLASNLQNNVSFCTWKTAHEPNTRQGQAVLH